MRRSLGATGQRAQPSRTRRCRLHTRQGAGADGVRNVTRDLDDLDRRLLRAFTEAPRLSVLEASRRLGVARGTVQARLERLERRGVLASWRPHLSPAAMGWAVTAFVTCLLYTSPSPRDKRQSRMPSSA